MKIFETVDGNGRKIYLTDERWSHIQRHENIVNIFDRITETLSKPTKIYFLEEDPRSYFYFRYYKDLKQYLKIIVSYLNGEGFIVTVYYTRNLK